MNRDTASKTSPAGADQLGADAPIDSDWPDRERAAKQRSAEDEDSDEDWAQKGDAADVKDEGILESLGKAVSSPVRDEVEPSARDGEPGKPERGD